MLARTVTLTICLACIFGSIIDTQRLDGQQAVNLAAVRVWPQQVVEVDDKAKTDNDSQTELFRSFSVEPTEASIRQYLLGLIPDNDIDERITPLVDKLSGDAFGVREQATKQLKVFPGLSPDAIRYKIRLATNPETRMRLGEVLQWLEKPDRTRIQFAIFKLIEKSPIENLAPAIVDSAPHLADHEYLHRAASQALAATAIPADVPRMIQVLENRASGEWMRVGALAALVRLTPDEAIARLPGLAQEASGNFGMEVARQLASVQDASCFELLIRLTGDNNRSVATLAWSALRGMTETTVPLNDLLDPVSRDQAVDQIRNHIASNHDMISFKWNRHGNKLGRSLIADYEKGIVREFDAAGQLTWSYESNNPFACQGLPNGHRLITNYSSNELLEFDEQGKLSGKFKLHHSSPSGVVRLDNGNTLVSSASSNAPIIEYSPNGASVREIRIKDTATAVELLENGNLLVTLFNKKEIAEIDALGNIVWKLSLPDQPYHAMRLENGNVLAAFCNAQEVREYTLGGEVVWKHKTDAKPFRAQRLGDGTTVTAGPDGIVFIGLDGSETSMIQGIEFGGTLFTNYF